MYRAKVQLDSDTEARLQGVRKELWWGGLQGLVVGSGIGIIGHTIASKYVHKKLNKSTLLATVLLTGSIGSFIGAVTFGKNAVQYIGDIFRENSNPTSTYRKQLQQNEQNVLDSVDDSYKNREEAIHKAVQSRDNKS